MERDLYAVVGHPISHSKSPRIHALFAAQTGERIDYTGIQAPLNGFRETVQGFFERGGKGLNVTLPFKEEAWALAKERTERAQVAGAVNTLYRDEQGEIRGDNTDGAGLVRDLIINHEVELTNRRVLILGAGGAVRGVLVPLLASRPAQVVIANRTPQKARALAQQVEGRVMVQGCGFEDIHDAYDVIINGTSASLQGDLPPLSPSIFHDASVSYDMMYGPDATPFNQWAQACGARLTLDGLGMLVEQAAESFLRWRGVRPDTGPVIAELRGSVG
jgi:shikimate dehydrogenase